MIYEIKSTANSCIALCSSTQFHERRQHFIGTHNETPSVAVSLNNEDVSPSHTFP
jgi:hypothetical protein